MVRKIYFPEGSYYMISQGNSTRDTLADDLSKLIIPDVGKPVTKQTACNFVIAASQLDAKTISRSPKRFICAERRPYLRILVPFGGAVVRRRHVSVSKLALQRRIGRMAQ
jgi:hypothetical protein